MDQPTDVTNPTDAAPPARLSDDLKTLLAHANGQPIALQGVLDALADRGIAVMILLLSAPFLINPIPGFSTAFGLAIGILSICVMFGIKPWLPGFISRRQISFERLQKVVHAVEWVLRKMEKISKPRLSFLCHRSFGLINGLGLLSLAFLLALPIPIPGNNIPPAIFLVILSFGLLERDGVLVIVGHLGNIGLWIALFLVGNLLLESLSFITDKLGWTTPSPATQQAALDLLSTVCSLIC